MKLKIPSAVSRERPSCWPRKSLAVEIDSETAELCQIITTETDRLRNLVDRLLGPSQLPRFAPINIHEVAEHVATLIEVEVQGGLTVVADYDPSIPDLSGDREQLIQAVLNVARNAMQAMLESDLPQRRLNLEDQNSTQLHHCRSASQGSLCR